MKKIILLALVLVLLSVSLSDTGLVMRVSGSTTHHVYPGQSIQDAINSAQSGDTVFVHAGTYYEKVVVNKSLSLVGEDRDKTIIDGNINAYLVNVEASNVEITGFTLQGWSSVNIYINGATNVTVNGNRILFIDAGVWIENSNNNVINGNIIEGSGLDNVGIIVVKSSGCIIENNTISYAVYYGIRLIWSANDNTIVGNNIKNNGYGIDIVNSESNTIYHNNFIDNGAVANWANTWDNGVEGNYWSRYHGTDLNGDGIIDTPYVINAKNRDNYPLMGMFHSFNASLGYDVNVISNSTIEDFQYFESNSTIRMYVSNSSATQSFGFCRVCISKGLMTPPYTVIIDDGLTPVLHQNYTLYDNGTHRWIYFAYEHSTHKVVIAPDTTPPTISILSPENKTYAVKDVPLTFTVSESTSWIGYSLDGEANVTITGNTTLSELSEGPHSLIVYVKDAGGNAGASEIIYFSIKTQKAQPFPILIVAAIVIIAIVGIALLVYFTKVKKTTDKGK